MQLVNGALLQGGKYRIEKVLGQGGFGITYLGEQTSLGRKVAIKEFFMKELCNRDVSSSHVSVGSEGSREMVNRFREKFLKEARNIAKLKHPNIVSVSDIFEENGTAYYVMDYCEGGSLSALLENTYPQGMPEGLALKYIREVASALDYIHKLYINHLDVKPANIMLGEMGEAVLIDFGLAKQYDSETGSQTSTTPVGISEGYAPMEQYRKGGVGQFSPTADIYSLGATLYKLVTGNRPPSPTEILNDGFPLLPSSVSAEVSTAIHASMQLRKVDRPQSIEEWLKFLPNAVTPCLVISSDITSVRTYYDDGPILGAIRYDFVAKKFGNTTFMVKNLNGEEKKIIVRGFHWKKFENLFNSLHLTKVENTEPPLVGGSFTTVELWKGEEIAIKAEQQTGGISNSGTLSGDVRSLHQFIESIPAIKSAIQSARNPVSTHLRSVTTSVPDEVTIVNSPTKETPDPNPEPSNLKRNIIITLIAVACIVGGYVLFNNGGADPVEEIESTFVEQPTGIVNGHEFVDLGLSVKWATMNVGASSPSDYGDYFAWGETSPKERYDWGNCFDCLDYTGDSWGIYYEGGHPRITPTSGHDTARENWGGTWRMPTDAENEELCEKCRWIWSKQGGHKGYEVTGPNGNSIFLPAAGWRYGTGTYYEGANSYYWSSTLSSSYSYNARGLYFDSSYHGTRSYGRRYGLSVRPVTE